MGFNNTIVCWSDDLLCCQGWASKSSEPPASVSWIALTIGSYGYTQQNNSGSNDNISKSTEIACGRLRILTVTATLEGIWQSLANLRTPHSAATPLLGIYPSEMKASLPTKPHHILTAWSAVPDPKAENRGTYTTSNAGRTKRNKLPKYA